MKSNKPGVKILFFNEIIFCNLLKNAFLVNSIYIYKIEVIHSLLYIYQMKNGHLFN